MHAPGPCTATATPAPKDNPHAGLKGVKLDMPYHKEVIGRIKQLPRWAWDFDGEEKSWIVDRAVWPYVKVVLHEAWGDTEDPSKKEEESTEEPATTDPSTKDTPNTNKTTEEAPSLFG